MSASQHPPEPENEWSHDAALGKRRITPARTRARTLEAPVLATVEERVDYIALLMVENVWSDHTTRECQHRLSEVWGLDTRTIRTYSAEASRKLHASAREEGGWRATVALRALTEVAERGSYGMKAGDMSASVMASEKLLKFAGLLEPEEDKSRPTTLIQVGQVVTSPVFGALLAGHEPKKLNGHTNGANGQTNGHAEGSDVVPNGRSDSAVGRKT